MLRVFAWLFLLMLGISEAQAAIGFVISYGRSGTGTNAQVRPRDTVAVATGNLYVAQIVVVNGSCASLGTPAGWTRHACTAQSNHIQAVYTRPAQPSDLNVTFNFALGGTRGWATILLVYSGVDLGNPIDAGPSSATYSNSKNAVAAAITTQTPGAWAVDLVSADYRGSGIFSPPSGFVERRERRCPNGVACTITASDREYPTPTTLAGITTTVQNNASGVVHLLALRPYSLVSYYPLDGLSWTQDLAGGNNLTAQGDAAPAAAKVCTGFQGTGSGWLTAPDSNSLDFSTRYSISVWVYPTAYPSPGNLKTILSKDTNYELHIDSAGRLYWWYQTTGGQTRILQSNAAIPLNQWTHVAVTFDRTVPSQRIYLNGSLDNTFTLTDTPLVNTASLYIGSDTGYTSGAANRNFLGLIDEVRIYNGTITQTQIAADMAASHDCGVNHYRVSLADGAGLTCSPEPVTITACANVDCSALYTGSVTVTLSATNGASISPNPVGFVGGSGGVNVSKSSAGVTTLGVTSAAPTPSGVPGYRCFVGGVEVPWASCQIAFQQARLVVDVPDFVACTGTTEATLTAEGCSGTVSGNLGVKLWMAYTDPPTGAGEALRIGNLVVPTAKPAANNLTLSFDSEGTAVLPLTNYDDAGDLTLFAELVASGTTLSGQGTFSVAPDRLEITPQDAAAVCVNTANPELCGAYRKAGQPFGLTLAARCSTGKVTKNFRATGIPLAATLKAPLGGNNGAFSPPSVDLGATDQGQKTFSATYGEVGVLTVTPGPVNYKGQVVDGVESPWLGRIFPDHFDTEATDACGTFTYSGQPFPLVVRARNASGGLTQNYSGVFARNVSFVDANGAAGTFGTLPAGAFAVGVADTTASPSVAFTFSNRFTAPATVRIRANDTDTVNAAGLAEGMIHVRSGRARLSNAHGSERLPLAVPLTTEYFAGGGFLTNVDDVCSTFASGQVGFSNWLRDLNPGETSVSGVSFSAGRGAIQLTAPGVGNSGSVDLTLDVPAWLEFPWTGAGPVDPRARATFGIYRGAAGMIYRREAY